MRRIKTMSAVGSERTKAGKGGVDASRRRADAGVTSFSGILRTKHGFAQIVVGNSAIRQKLQFRILRRTPDQRLLRAVVDAGNPKRKELQGCTRHHLVVRRRAGGEANFR